MPSNGRAMGRGISRAVGWARAASWAGTCAPTVDALADNDEADGILYCTNSCGVLLALDLSIFLAIEAQDILNVTKMKKVN